VLLMFIAGGECVSVIEIALSAAEQHWWRTEGNAIQDVLGDHFGSGTSAAEYTATTAVTRLRSELRVAAPRLTGLADRLRTAFDVNDACAVLIPRLGLAEAGLEAQRKGVFALAALLGTPTANLPYDQVIWDVRSSISGRTSFSQNDRDADYHADNGALRLPERFFFLYAVHAARCGGGLSLIRDGRVLKQQLERTPEGRAATRVLAEAIFPRRVPKHFRQYGVGAEDGFRYTPLLMPDRQPPMWRWRKDRVYQGLAARPDYATVEVKAAVDLLADTLTNQPDQLRQLVPNDGLIMINNHLALHGRTAFSDPGRHMLRLRFHDPSPSLLGPTPRDNTFAPPNL
jgi:alpha-ketoglutarate-dependent taurine dioxygenase